MAWPETVTVLGASMAGLLAAAACSGDGRQVCVVERDLLPDAPQPRRGVPQDRQTHVLLQRGLEAAEQLLPGLGKDLEAAGAVRINTGDIAWLGPDGWLPRGRPSYEVLSVTRPVVERLVRRRVEALPGVRFDTGRRVTGLHRSADPDRQGWVVTVAGGPYRSADLVLDASGRGSHLSEWLAAGSAGTPVRVPTTVVDARLGYATRRYTLPEAGDEPPPELVTVVVQAVPDAPVGGMAIPVEGADWLVSANGTGSDRPGRDGFEAFLDRLRDPALARLVACLRPVDDVAIHRQTGNLRRHYERVRPWPSGLLVVGDALCAFNPVYGQGMTVAACEALEIRRALRRGLPPAGTGRLQRSLARLVELPWAVATGQDRRFASAAAPESLAQRVLSAWSGELGALAAHGNGRAADTTSRVYHLKGRPAELFHPALVAAVIRARIRGYGPGVERPLPAGL